MDEQQIKDQYRAFYRAAIAKDKAGMEATLDESFHAVFGGGHHTWQLQLDMKAERIDGYWKFTDAVASTF